MPTRRRSAAASSFAICMLLASSCGDSAAETNVIAGLCAKDAKSCSWVDAECEDRYRGLVEAAPTRCLDATEAYFECQLEREPEPCWDYGHRSDVCRPELDALLECVPKDVQWTCPYTPDACGECRYACCSLLLDCTGDLECAPVLAAAVRCGEAAQDEAARARCRAEQAAGHPGAAAYAACLDACSDCP
jgi:hypothetical protein